MSDIFNSEFYPWENLCPFPGGVCTNDWVLRYANPALRDFFKGVLPISAGTLHAWFEQGSLTEMANSSKNPAEKNGCFLYRHASGNSFLLFWHAKNFDSSTTLRCFFIHQANAEWLSAISQNLFGEFDNILDFIHDGIWLIDGKGITLRINKAMERIAGIKAKEVVGRHVSEPLREGRFKTCVTLHALQTRQTVTLFDDYSNGKRCLNTSTPIFDSAGNVKLVIAAIRDITELDNLQHKLSKLEVEAMAYRLRAEGLENQIHSVLLGQSPKLQQTLQDISKAAQTDAVTLILGETGTGKSLAARTIHELGNRAQKPFISVNCSAIPAALMESELFGYEKGAFTGASRSGKPGLFELASGGTLLLDEIAELALPLQAKLLHILDGQPVYRVGGIKPIHINSRILAATNKNLGKMVKEGKFREDLFYRLRILNVEMPPLRDRKDDILLLSWHFLEKNAAESGKRKFLDSRVEQMFLAYSWPGNIRELQNVIQSLVTLCENERICPEDLPSYMHIKKTDKDNFECSAATMAEAVAKLEREMLGKALIETGSTYKAARKLGLSQSSVVRKAKKYGLSKNLVADAVPNYEQSDNFSEQDARSKMNTLQGSPWKT